MKYLLFLLALLTLSIARAETIYVTLEKDNALAVVDGIDGKLVKTVKVGLRPRGIALSHDRKQLYVAVSDSHSIQVLDVATLKIVGKLPSGRDPETFAVDPSGERLYVSNEDDNLVTVVDVASQKIIKQIPVGVEPEGIAVSPDGRWVVCASETTNMAHWIDAKTLEVVDNTLVDARPRALSFSADSKQLWVTSEMAGSVAVLDADTHQIIKTISFQIPGVLKDKIQPVGVKIDDEGRWAYVALGPANRVAVIDAEKLEVSDYLLVGQRVWNIAFDPAQRYLYTANGASNDISTIGRHPRHTVSKSIAVGNYPWGLVVRP
ncbi:MAG: hypothetical protein EPN21_01205 [Methylococcaceae bacterium]|nr:MAG: hypothetical protein EPN21_01205 [Methylococcaceae bacterium]